MKNLRERNNEAARKYRKNNPEKRRFIQAPKLGITKIEVESCLIKQNHQCAVCGERFIQTPHIDHDHKTNKFRGLLCKSCNWLLGHAKDKISILEKAIQYLKKHGVSNEEAPPLHPHPCGAS